MFQRLCEVLYYGGSRLAFVGAFFVIVLSVGTSAEAEVYTIDPADPPEVTLPPDEAETLRSLINVDLPYFISELSPNGKIAFVNIGSKGPAFLNVQTGQATPVDSGLLAYEPLTELQWKNNRTLMVIGADVEGIPYIIEIDAKTGDVSREVAELPGYPVSLSTRGKKVLIARPAETEDMFSTQRSDIQKVSPFEEVDRRPNYHRTVPSPVGLHKSAQARVALAQLALVVYELKTGNEQHLMDVSQDDSLIGVVWSPCENRLALTRLRSPDNNRGSGAEVTSDSIQDALGNLPPGENPFFLSNALDIFTLNRKSTKHQQLRPSLLDGAVFGGAIWSSDGRFLFTKMLTPSTPKGRPYPVYGIQNSAFYRAYLPNGSLLQELNAPEIDAVLGEAVAVSSSEVVFRVTNGLSSSLYYYNLYNRRLERLPTPTGTIYQVYAAKSCGKLVYNFSSYDQPPEIFRLSIPRGDPLQVTSLNEAAKAAGAVRSVPVQFVLDSGARRSGYLLHPADESDSVEDRPLVVWQQGGPIASMTVEWGGQTEAPFNILPNFGISVLVVPLPGRDGFGPEFLDGLSDNTNFGQIDIDEQLEIVDQLVDAGVTSWDRVGVTGCSYGGYFTSQSVTSYGETYAAANTQCTLIDLFDEWEFGYSSFITYLMGRTPIDDWDEFYRDSPLQRGHLVQTPTLIFAGTEDFLPSDYSLDFHNRIVDAGTDADFYEFIGEPHGLRQVSSQFTACQAQIEWFRKYLGE